MRDLHFRIMTLHWPYMRRSIESQRVRTKPMMQIWPINSLQTWHNVLTGVFTLYVVDETSMQITLGRTVIGTNTVLTPSNRPSSAKVPRVMYIPRAQMIHLDKPRSETTLNTKGSRTVKVSSKENRTTIPRWMVLNPTSMRSMRRQPYDIR